MQDFIRIGGPITSSPLNENFRRLANAIDLSNMNLVFPEENGIVNTVDDMYGILDPLDGQVCYVVSSGEFYRYSKKDNKWHKIMDIGQTFRQGFLNSGVVVMEGPMTLKPGSLTYIQIPAMLVYFKNKVGDGRYLRGMYKIDSFELDISSKVDGANAYSIFVNAAGVYNIITGMPTVDDVNNVFIGTFLADGQGRIIQIKDGNSVISTCLYTLPDIAYTADRGGFIMNGGQSNGMNLTSNAQATVNRKEGFYYDEGINYSVGKTANFPADTDNGSNYDLKFYDGEFPVEYLIYMEPENGLNQPLKVSKGLINNKYWTPAGIKDVPEGYFTVQQHLVTPSGQNIMLYGTVLYNSITDAMSNVNSVYGINIDFPYVEATRVVIGNVPNFTTDNMEHCRFYTMGRLAQVGTIKPEFADNAFLIYSGDADDVTPSSVRFDLGDLQAEDYEGLYSLDILPSAVTRNIFSLSKKYIIDGTTQTMTTTLQTSRSYGTGTSGYKLADDEDLLYIRNRLDSIEDEIWSVEKTNKKLYEQSIRYRLFHAEERLDDIELTLEDHENRIKYLEQYKVHKNTTVNGYKLGDGTANNEAKAIVLYTGDIDEGRGLGTTTNLWFTQERVSQNTDVINAKNHINTISANDNAAGHRLVNPHHISTDDLYLLNGTTRVFVTPEEERRIRSDRLPENTIAELAKKLENINIQQIGGSSGNPGSTTNLGDVIALRFYEYGAKVTVDKNNRVATIECVGQFDEDEFMKKDEFAVNAKNRPDLYGGAVDRALNADNLTALDGAGPDQYYGTNEDGDRGVWDLPVYVSTMDASSLKDVDQVAFQPIDRSVTLKHLADGKVTYTPKSEETELQTNVYDLVKNHYHKVFNSGSQGPYLNGSTTQDTSAIKYQYEVPSGGKPAHVYYFTYNNTSYKFTTTATVAAKTVFTFVPSTKALSYVVPGGSAVNLTVTEVVGETVDNDYWLPFVAKTDWNKINEWNFGNNLTVTVTDGRATINAAVAGNGATNFANLGDTDVTYNEANVGKMVVLGKDGSNNFKLQFMTAPALNNYMLIRDYVDSTVEQRVKYAAKADLATVAVTANTLQNNYTVNDSGTSATVLWSASKIKTNTSAQIKAEGVNTYYGTSAPTTVAGSKDGDLYILIEN